MCCVNVSVSVHFNALYCLYYFQFVIFLIFFLTCYTFFGAFSIFLRMEFQHGFGISVPQLEGICSGVCFTMCLLCGSSDLHAGKSEILPGGRKPCALYDACYESFIVGMKTQVMCCYFFFLMPVTVNVSSVNQHMLGI